MFVWHCNNQKAILKCHKLRIQKVFEFERQHVSDESNKLPVNFFIFYQNINLSEGRPC